MHCALHTHFPGHWTSSCMYHFNSLLEHTALQPFRHKELVAHIAISVLPGTHLYLSWLNWSTWGEVPCPRINIECQTTMCQSWEERSMKILHQAGIDLPLQAAAIAKRYSTSCATSLYKECWQCDIILAYMYKYSDWSRKVLTYFRNWSITIYGLVLSRRHCRMTNICVCTAYPSRHKTLDQCWCNIRNDFIY